MYFCCNRDFPLLTVRIEGQAVLPALLQEDTVIRFVGKAAARLLCGKLQIMRIDAEQRSVRADGQTGTGTALPAVQAVIAFEPVIPFSAAGIKLEAAVFNHFRVQSTVQCIVDIFQEQTEHSFVHRAFYSVCNDHRIHLFPS